ncbi:hypothetical protein [Fervidibacillus albus]|uniref:Uncharacterized protein n=1 Tax=Fervidibacillus albus TaxID=2980026 RepID=A0A9E8LSF5_9BACI|nr:hypothetical protein [Fervidibacillus albus]WAA08662.1 hypothetical protein OE104_08380 [Fervidibacillus albus]
MAERKTTHKNNERPNREDFERRFNRFMFGERAIRHRNEVKNSLLTKEKEERKRNDERKESRKTEQTVEFYEQLNQLIGSASKLRSMARKLLK